MKFLFILFSPFLLNGQIQIGQDIDGESAGHQSGHSLSLSADGSIVAIGAINSSGNGTSSGHVRIFENINGTWSQIGQNINGEAAGDESGHSLSLSADGSIVAIGSINSSDSGVNSGHVRIFENINGSWSQIGQDIDGEFAGDQSGHSVSLSTDGSIVAIGAKANSGNGNSSGHVRIFENINGTWIQIGQDINGETAGDQSGQSVSLNADGTVVAVGAVFNSGNGNGSGHVRIYENINGSWTQIGQDIDGETAGDQSGHSVSINADGSIVAIGARNNQGINGSLSGHVRVYQNINGSWTQIGQDIDGEAMNDQFGEAISLSDDGSILAVGASSNQGNGLFSGHTRIYNLSAILSSSYKNIFRIHLYPNPTKGQFSIQFYNPFELKSINIYNNLGQLVLKSNKSTVDTTNLNTGIYSVIVETIDVKITKKLIIE